jgi:AraC-like DNA-binding protein
MNRGEGATGMAETLFAIDRRNVHECQQLFRGERELEYYRGDYWIEDQSVIDVRADRKSVGSSSIIRLRSATRLSFRRTRQHIREDATDLSVLWFVKRGTLVFTNQLGTHHVSPGDFLITRSMSPFLIECQPDAEGQHEVLHVTVPWHILSGFVPGNAGPGVFIPAARPAVAIVEKILTHVFEDDGGLPDDTVRTLVETAFTVVGHAVRGEREALPPRQTVVEKRLQDVMRFIEVHLSDPNLSVAMVARGCGISPRYLSSLLKQNATSFSQLMWDRRLEQARHCISRSDPRDISISAIAYDVGFKSPAHFSRMFKRTFHVNPSNYRSSAAQGARHEEAVGMLH